MSQEIRFVCPTCKAVMSSPVQKAGQKIHCLKCGQRLAIPAAERAKTIVAASVSSAAAATPAPVEAPATQPVQMPPSTASQPFPSVPAPAPSDNKGLIIRLGIGGVTLGAIIGLILFLVLRSSTANQIIGKWVLSKGGNSSLITEFTSDGRLISHHIRSGRNEIAQFEVSGYVLTIWPKGPMGQDGDGLFIRRRAEISGDQMELIFLESNCRGPMSNQETLVFHRWREKYFEGGYEPKRIKDMEAIKEREAELEKLTADIEAKQAMYEQMRKMKEEHKAKWDKTMADMKRREDDFENKRKLAEQKFMFESDQKKKREAQQKLDEEKRELDRKRADLQRKQMASEAKMKAEITALKSQIENAKQQRQTIIQQSAPVYFYPPYDNRHHPKNIKTGKEKGGQSSKDKLDRKGYQRPPEIDKAGELTIEIRGRTKIQNERFYLVGRKPPPRNLKEFGDFLQKHHKAITRINVLITAKSRSDYTVDRLLSFLAGQKNMKFQVKTVHGS